MTWTIYFSHPKKGFLDAPIDYERMWYGPLRDVFAGHNLILPHEKGSDPIDSRTILNQEKGIFIIERSVPHNGLIELGWASNAKWKIVTAYDSEVRIGSAGLVTQYRLPYSTREEFTQGLVNTIKQIEKDTGRE